jgi:cAMP-binding proteins - catabolite gene activator and regulatory subunit of cAMP-dependent protein kinases
MEEYKLLLQESLLFSGIGKEDVRKLVGCLSFQKKTIACDTYVFRAEDPINYVYLIISGSMHIVDEDFWGNRTIVETMEKHTLFGEAYVLSETERYLVSVVAAEDSIILEIDPIRLFEICPAGCSYHIKLINNMMCILSEKIVRLTGKLRHVVQRTTREKILSYLSQCGIKAQSTSFYIPYSRQQLADYLCVDRSALSHELSKLHNQGVIRYRKNYFELQLEDKKGL